MSTPIRLKRNKPDSTPPEEPMGDVVIKGHTYDGIKEYDNPMPGWWLWTFYATIAFSVLYVPGVHLFGWINSYEDDLREQTEELADIRAAYAQANPTFNPDPETLARFVENEAMQVEGATVYATSCAACHGDVGQGLIGPNLADNFWIHGGSHLDVYTVITEGVLDKGMPGWENSLTAEQRAALVAYIHTLKGTNPSGAKEPQGEEYVEE